MQTERKEPVAAQPEERTAGYVQVQEVPAAVLRGERAAGEVQVQTPPAVETEEDVAATTHVQAEDAPDATALVAYTNVFQVEKVIPPFVGGTTVYIDSAASSHMVCTESRMSNHVINPSRGLRCGHHRVVWHVQRNQER